MECTGHVLLSTTKLSAVHCEFCYLQATECGGHTGSRMSEVEKLPCLFGCGGDDAMDKLEHYLRYPVLQAFVTFLRGGQFVLSTEDTLSPTELLGLSYDLVQELAVVFKSIVVLRHVYNTLKCYIAARKHLHDEMELRRGVLLYPNKTRARACELSVQRMINLSTGGAHPGCDEMCHAFHYSYAP